MRSAFWGAVRKFEHPAFDFSGDFVCICGHRTREQKEHNNHVFENHSREEAEKLLSANDFRRLYKTEEYLSAEAKRKQKRQKDRVLRALGYRFNGRFMGSEFWDCPEGKFATKAERDAVFLARGWEILATKSQKQKVEDYFRRFPGFKPVARVMDSEGRLILVSDRRWKVEIFPFEKYIFARRGGLVSRSIGKGLSPDFWESYSLTDEHFVE